MSEKEPLIRHTFSSQERYILINLAEQILELLGSPPEARDPLHDVVGISGSELPPDDPVLKRLLPSAYKEIQDAAEFRRYTEDALREKKRAHAYLIREALIDDEGLGEEIVQGDKDLESTSIRISIKSEDAWSWLGGLNDIRLALAVRLEIGGTTMGDLPSDSHRVDKANAAGGVNEAQKKVHLKFELMTDSDPMKAVYAVYNWLGWLQEEFLKQMDPEVQSES
ncbi:MAG: DUF2017 domain-containing protein, partial [Actinobacteria bacterium]|nr:DUF2017 domain-containing protein [Actinomycetota bacterium]